MIDFQNKLSLYLLCDILDVNIHLVVPDVLCALNLYSNYVHALIDRGC